MSVQFPVRAWKLRINQKIAHDFAQEKLCAELQRNGCDIFRSCYAKYEAAELNVKVSVLAALKRIYIYQYDDFFVGVEDK